MSELIVAHRYAKSLLDFAIEKNAVEAVAKDMIDFAETCDGSYELVLALKSPIIKHYTKLAILAKLFKDKFNPVTYGIFVIITNKNREKILPAVAKEFISMYTDYKGIQKAIKNVAYNTATKRSEKPTTPELVNVTDSQLETMRLVAQGKSNNEIAKIRGVSEKSIEQSISRLVSNLDLPKGVSSNQRVQISKLYFKLTGSKSGRDE